MEVEVNVSPSKKARKVFAQNVPNRTARSLLPAIDHLAAAGAEVATDALRSYASLGKSLRPVFVENCRLGKQTFVPIQKLLCAFVQLRKTNLSAWSF